MKKFLTYLTFIMIGSFIIGAITFKSGGGFKANKVSVNQTKNVEITNINNIELNTYFERVEVKKTSGASVQINLTGEMFGKDSEPEVITELIPESGRLSISLRRHGHFIFINDWGNLNLELLLPESYTGALSVSSDSGRINITDLSLNKVRLESTSGRIEANLLSGAVEAETVSGRIDLTLGKLNNNLSLKSTSGRINLTIPQNSDYNFKMSTTSGGFHNLTSDKIDKIHRDGYEGSAGQKTYNINIDTVSGSVELNKK